MIFKKKTKPNQTNKPKEKKKKRLACQGLGTRRLRCVYLHRGQHRKIRPGKPHCRKSTQKQKNKKQKTKEQKTHSGYWGRQHAHAFYTGRWCMNPQPGLLAGANQRENVCVRTHARRLQVIFHGMQRGRGGQRGRQYAKERGRGTTILYNKNRLKKIWCPEEEKQGFRNLRSAYSPGTILVTPLNIWKHWLPEVGLWNREAPQQASHRGRSHLRQQHVSEGCVWLRISSSTGLRDFVSDIHTSPAFTLHIRHAIRFGWSHKHAKYYYSAS